MHGRDSVLESPRTVRLAGASAGLTTGSSFPLSVPILDGHLFYDPYVALHHRLSFSGTADLYYEVLAFLKSDLPMRRSGQMAATAAPAVSMIVATLRRFPVVATSHNQSRCRTLVQIPVMAF